MTLFLRTISLVLAGLISSAVVAQQIQSTAAEAVPDVIRIPFLSRLSAKLAEMEALAREVKLYVSARGKLTRHSV